ncbi:MAG: hypothetical protein SRB2_03588 [Desulfobacteraceae bacterium Eth-SRB2]|nr:MAG: hypothetical protein SRB2_03588 [Desulfobacteraceae bacterium Eth-SRB2]
MHSRKLALAMAKQHRQCPPPDIIQDPLQQDQIKLHCSICPYCSTDLSSDIPFWDKFSQMIVKKYSKAGVTEPDISIRPGQFRRITYGLAGWKDGFYYSPPLILVLESNESRSNTALVAQTFHDIALAGPEDLILSAEQTGCGELFVQCWHIYTLKADDLEPPLGQINPDIFNGVKRMTKNHNDLPDWVLMPPPLTEQDPRKYFRELEVDTGYFFASQSVGRLIEDLEHHRIRMVYSSPDQVIQAFNEKIDGIFCPVPVDTMEEALAALELPEEYYPLAAADKDKKTVAAKFVFIQNQKIMDLKGAEAEIYSVTPLSGRVAVSGKIHGLPENPDESTFLCSLFSEDYTKAFLAEKTEWDPEQGFFYAEFSTDRVSDLDFRITLVFET